MILIAVGGLVSLFLLGYVVPRFSHIYEDIGGDLPWLTRVLMAWGKFVEARGGMLLAGVVAAVTGAGAVAAPAVRPPVDRASDHAHPADR